MGFRDFFTRPKAAPPPPPIEREPEPPEQPSPPVAAPPPQRPPPSPLTLTPDLRARHLYIVGKSGTGKTTLLKNLIRADLENYEGATFIDPHGDAALDLLGHIPEDRIEDVIYFDPTSLSAPAFNLLALPYAPAKLTDDIISAFKMLFDSWGPRLEHILAHGLLTLLLDAEPHSLRDLHVLLTNPTYRDAIALRVTDEQLRAFWTDEYPHLPKDAAAPIINKLSTFLRPTSDLARIFSQRTNALDFSAIMNEGRVLIVNLSKGTLGEESSRFLGALFATAIQQAALARTTIPEHERRPHYFYVDEFQNYTTASFETILSEARKYRLSLTLANQTLGQLPASLERSIFGNVATLVAFQVSAEDANHLTREMTSTRTIFRAIQDGRVFTVPEFNNFLRELLPAIEKHLDEDLARAIEDTLTQTLGSRERARETIPSMMANARRIRREEQSVKAGTLSALHFSEFKLIAQLRETLSHSDLLPEHLRQILGVDFGGMRLRDLYEIREETSPTSTDLLNLRPLHAFMRIERAENVFPITTTYPPPPNAETRAAILARHAKPPEPAPSSPATTAPLAAPPTEPPPVPKPDDDFTF